MEVSSFHHMHRTATRGGRVGWWVPRECSLAAVLGGPMPNIRGGGLGTGEARASHIARGKHTGRFGPSQVTWRCRWSSPAPFSLSLPFSQRSSCGPDLSVCLTPPPLSTDRMRITHWRRPKFSRLKGF